MFYAGLLEKLGVTAHVFRVGTYKSAVEPYMLNAMSPAARENYEQLYGALWQEWQAHLTRARPKANVRRVTGEIGDWLAASTAPLARSPFDAASQSPISPVTRRTLAFGRARVTCACHSCHSAP